MTQKPLIQGHEDLVFSGKVGGVIQKYFFFRKRINFDISSPILGLIW